MSPRQLASSGIRCKPRLGGPQLLLLPGSWLASGEQQYWSCDQKLLEMKVSQIVNNIPGYDKSLLVVDVA